MSIYVCADIWEQTNHVLIVPSPGSIQGQAGSGSEKLGPVKGVPAPGRGLEWDDPEGPFQPKLFYVSIILWKDLQTIFIYN